MSLAYPSDPGPVGMAWPGRARPGQAGLVQARQSRRGKRAAGQSRPGAARFGPAVFGASWCRVARQSSRKHSVKPSAPPVRSPELVTIGSGVSVLGKDVRGYLG